MGIEVSVIVPTYRRPVLLQQCLESLWAQSYSSDKFEVIVIDDGGGVDGTSALLSRMAQEHANLFVLKQNHRGPAVARNAGVLASRGTIICFIDDDCVATKDWLRLMCAQHAAYPQAAAVGGLTTTSTETIPVLLGQFLANNSIEIMLNGKREVVFFPTCNVSFKRHVLEAFRFNEHFPLPGGEDLELFWRLFKDGYRFQWDKGIQVIHYRQDTWASCFHQAYIYGRGNYLVQFIHQDQPLLHELKTGLWEFWFSVFVNMIKIPRFCFLQGNGLIREKNVVGFAKKMEVYSCFFGHKVFYIAGNCVERFRVKQDMRAEETAVRASY